MARLKFFSFPLAPSLKSLPITVLVQTRLVHVGFVVDKVAMGQVELLQFFRVPSCQVPRLIHTHTHTHTHTHINYQHHTTSTSDSVVKQHTLKKNRCAKNQNLQTQQLAHCSRQPTVKPRFKYLFVSLF